MDRQIVLHDTDADGLELMEIRRVRACSEHSRRRCDGQVRSSAELYPLLEEILSVWSALLDLLFEGSFAGATGLVVVDCRSRRIACDVAPSDRSKDAPRQRPRCLAAANLFGR